MLCDETQTVIGFSAEALDMLGIASCEHKDVLKNATLVDIIPQLNNQQVMSAVLRREGAVVSPTKLALQIDHDSSSLLTHVDSTVAQPFVWMRLVQEEYGQGEKSFVLVMSPIVAELKDKYLPSAKMTGIYESTARCVLERKKLPTTYTSAVERMASNTVAKESTALEQEDSASTSQPSSENSGSSASESLSAEIELRLLVGRKTPVSIVRLYIVSVVLLIIVSVLISIANRLSFCGSGERGDVGEFDQQSCREIRPDKDVPAALQAADDAGQRKQISHGEPANRESDVRQLSEPHKGETGPHRGLQCEGAKTAVCTEVGL